MQKQVHQIGDGATAPETLSLFLNRGGGQIRDVNETENEMKY